MMERKGDWAQIYSGKKFWPLDPKPEEVDINDIAHSLAFQCRFNGHTIPFYSIAQHSVLVSKIVSPEQALAGLFHDASETYTGDIVSPLKKFLPPAFKEIEKAIEEVIFEHFGIKDINHSEIKKADKIALFTEMRDLMENRPDKWDDEDLFEPHPEKIVALSPEKAEQEFLERYEELIKKRE
jgi:5'-deoxynucleotidase YfbR-like HD superfamily hydrolase